MDWERVEAARRRARFMLAIPWVALAILAFGASSLTGDGVSSGPFRNQEQTFASPIPISLPQVVGVVGFLIGYVWMWKLYRAPTRFEGAHWRFHDH